MLIDFTVSNYRSFKESSTISFEPGERLRKYKDTNLIEKQGEQLLKNVIVFGPNGAGKSNLINAIQFMYQLIKVPTVDVSDKIKYIPFKMCSECEMLGTYFNIRFLYNDYEYDYEFKYNSTTIIHEKLSYRISGGKATKKVYFEREYNDFVVLPNQLDSIRHMVRKNKLFLSLAQDMNDAVCGDVINWFTNEVIFFNQFRADNFFELLEDENYKKTFIKFMNYAGVNLIDVEVKKTVTKMDEKLFKALSMLVEDGEVERETVVSELYLTYKTYNENGDVVGTTPLKFESESRGTKKLIQIGLAMLQSENRGKLLVIDEFDDSIHTRLSRALVKLFNSVENNNQYLLTSHEIDLMDCGLRVDQIFLVEKEFDGISKLLSLFDFNEISGSGRSDISYASRYLKGHFGALPNINVEGILDAFERN